MMVSRFPATCRFISTSRVCPRASAALMICRTWVRFSRGWGRNSPVVTSIGQVRQAFACGQGFWTGRPENPLGKAWVARPKPCLAQAASASPLSGSKTTVVLLISIFRAVSQWRRMVMVVSCRRA